MNNYIEQYLTDETITEKLIYNYEGQVLTSVEKVIIHDGQEINRYYVFNLYPLTDIFNNKKTIFNAYGQIFYERTAHRLWK